MTRTFTAATAALALCTIAATAHEYKAGTLMVDHPFAFETPKTAMAAGGFLTIKNTGETADRLIGVEADFPRVEIHTTEEVDGVAKMKHVIAIDVPAGETVSLVPGGLHVMFMGLNGDPFEEGESVPATLIFEQAGRLDITFKVEKRSTSVHSGDADHAGHDHSGHSVSN